jgi:hypothetical protein
MHRNIRGSVMVGLEQKELWSTTHFILFCFKYTEVDERNLEFNEVLKATEEKGPEKPE